MQQLADDKMADAAGQEHNTSGSNVVAKEVFSQMCCALTSITPAWKMEASGRLVSIALSFLFHVVSLLSIEWLGNDSINSHGLEQSPSKAQLWLVTTWRFPQSLSVSCHVGVSFTNTINTQKMHGHLRSLQWESHSLPRLRLAEQQEKVTVATWSA